MIRAAMRSLLLAVAAVVCVATSAAAHGAGTSQVTLRLDGARIEGEWEIHLRDARWALGRDTTQVGEGALRDLRAHEPELRALLMRTLALAGDSLACPLELTAAPLEWLPRFEEVRFHLIARCPNEPTRLRIGNEWMFDLDPTHRAYFSVVDARATSVGVLRATLRSVTFTVRQFHFGQIASEFLLDGVRHLWLRLDYVLFLLALLMPTVLIREGGAWRPRPGIAAAVRVAAPLLAAFAIGQAIALWAGYFGVVRVPSQWASVALALSVFAIAWNNLRPFAGRRAPAIVGFMGACHGLAMSGALANMALPTRSRVVALGGFHLGVELAMLVVCVLALPVWFAASRSRFYPRVVMGVGSLAIAWMAVVWVLERAFSLALFAGR